MLLENHDENFFRLVLSRPNKHNALNKKLMIELWDNLGSYRHAPGTRKALIIEGSGESFCAGADLEWMKDMVNFSHEENIEDSNHLFKLFYAFYSFPLPVISIAHGNVFGGGLGFLAASDYVVAHKKTKYCFSEVKLGLAPAVISSFVLSKCNPGMAQALMTSGKVFNTSEAFHIGLVQQSYETEKDFEDVLKNYSMASQEALIETKKLCLLQRSVNPLDFQEKTVECITKLRSSNEGQQRIQKFLARKK